MKPQSNPWDEWNLEWRPRHGDPSQFDPTMKGQYDEVDRVAQQLHRPGTMLRILEVGCGTGWLAGSLTRHGSVVATDYAGEVVDGAAARYPDVTFVGGDFLELTVDDLGGPFDLIVSVDVMAHVADHAEFIRRIRSLLKRGAVFVLLTQNSFVFNRTSDIIPNPTWLRNWPRLADLKTMMADTFTITHVGSAIPGGDRGILRLTNSRWIRKGFKVIGLGGVWRSALERMMLGKDLVIVATAA